MSWQQLGPAGSILKRTEDNEPYLATKNMHSEWGATQWQTSRSYIIYILHFVYCIYGLLYIYIYIYDHLCTYSSPWQEASVVVCQLTAPHHWNFSGRMGPSLEDRHPFACYSLWCMSWSGAGSTWPMASGFALWICGGIWWVNWNGHHKVIGTCVTSRCTGALQRWTLKESQGFI